MPTVNADLAWAIDDVRDRQRALALFKDYDEGRHRLLFATDKFLNTFGHLFQEFADNLCDDVVDAMADRMQITGWSAPTALEQPLQEAWKRNQGVARTGAIMRHGFRDGDGFAIVQVSSDQHARFYKQDPRLMAVRYSTDAPDEMEVASKVWLDRALKRYRVNLYYPDRTEKYASKGVGASGGIPQAAQFRLLAAGDKALAADEDNGLNEHDDGLPVYHFPNGELSQYGRSILAGVIPIQDALNKSIADMLVTMEAHAAPLRWATGVQTEIDPVTNQEKDPFKKQGATPGSVLRVGSKDARLGQFDPSEMTGFLEVQDSFKVEAARKGAMPPHQITLRSQTGNAPSGISLLVAEGRTIKLAKDRQRDWGTEKRRMMAHLLNLELGTKTVQADDLEPNWAPPETRDMLALLEELVIKKDLGVPTEQLLKEAGYDPKDVAEFMGQIVAENEDQAAALQVLQGGRQSATRGQARALGVPAGPTPPGGAATALAQD